MPLDDRLEHPSRPGPAAETVGGGAPEVGTVALLVGSATAVIVVTAALTRYVLELAAASARTTWRPRVRRHAGST